MRHRAGAPAGREHRRTAAAIRGSARGARPFAAPSGRPRDRRPSRAQFRALATASSIGVLRVPTFPRRREVREEVERRHRAAGASRTEADAQRRRRARSRRSYRSRRRAATKLAGCEVLLPVRQGRRRASARWKIHSMQPSRQDALGRAGSPRRHPRRARGTRLDRRARRRPGARRYFIGPASGRRSDGQPQARDRAAVPAPVLERQAAAVRLGDLPRQHEADARAARLGREERDEEVAGASEGPGRRRRPRSRADRRPRLHPRGDAAARSPAPRPRRCARG